MAFASPRDAVAAAAAAQRALREAVVDRAGGDDWVSACCTHNLALSLLLGGHDGEAVEHVREALTWFIAFGDNDGLIERVELSMAVVLRRGDGVTG